MDDIELIFGGPGVTPETLDARASLSTALAYVDALMAVAGYDSHAPQPFTVSFTELKSASVDFVLKCRPEKDVVLAERAWNNAPKRVEAYILDPDHAPKQVSPQILTLRKRTLALPPGVSLHCRMNGWTAALSNVARQPAPPISHSIETMRVLIEKTGGREPRVTVYSESDDASFSLLTTKAIAIKAGAHLYRLVDIEADVARAVRAPDYPVIKGRLINILDNVLEQDAVAAWDTWYQRAGRPWSSVDDFEAHLKRHDA